MIIIRGDGTTLDVSTPTRAQAKATYLVTLTGTDGTVWDLNRGPVQLMAGVRLFDAPPVEQWLKRSVGIPGARRTGMQVDEQTLLLPVRVKAPDNQWRTYRDLEQAFFAGLDPDQPVLITVTSPDAIAKTITGWFTGPGDLTDETDPLILKRRSYQLGFDAPDAYWSGTLVHREVSLAPPVPWLDPPGPPIYLNPPNASQNATIDNPGDVPAWARITIPGPATAYTIGIGDALFTSTTPLAATDQILIDSATRSIVNAAGVRVFEELDTIIFKPVRKGTGIQINVDVTAAGTKPILVDLTPLYRRPL